MDPWQVAIREAKKSTIQYKHGAVVVNPKNGTIIRAAYNWENKELVHGKRSLHAEFRATVGLAREKIKGMDLYVVRVGAASMGYPLRLSKPCQCCLNYLAEKGISRVFYSLDVQDMAMVQYLDKFKPV